MSSALISDIDFMRNGKKDPGAGVDFARAVKNRMVDIPVLLQSSNAEAQRWREASALLPPERISTLLHDLSQFVKKNFGFRRFYFPHLPDGTEVDVHRI